MGLGSDDHALLRFDCRWRTKLMLWQPSSCSESIVRASSSSSITCRIKPQVAVSQMGL